MERSTLRWNDEAGYHQGHSEKGHRRTLLIWKTTWGEDHWNGDTIAYVGPVSLSGTYMLADETVLVRGEARAVIQSRMRQMPDADEHVCHR